MMNTLQVFTNEKFGQVRILLIDDEVYTNFYYNRCKECGETKKVPKTIKRPSEIKRFSLNQLISTNKDWYEATIDILKRMSA